MKTVKYQFEELMQKKRDQQAKALARVERQREAFMDLIDEFMTDRSFWEAHDVATDIGNDELALTKGTTTIKVILNSDHKFDIDVRSPGGTRIVGMPTATLEAVSDVRTYLADTLAR